MTRDRYRVVSVEMAEQHAGETVWRVRMRSAERMEPTFVLHVSQRPGRSVPFDVGSLIELDARLVEREG